MSRTSDIQFFSTRFVSKETEAAYQHFEFKRNLRANVIGISLGIFALFAYIFADSIDSAAPQQSVLIRLGGTILSLALLSLLLSERFVRRQDTITTLIVTVLGLSLNAIISLQPNLDNTYYIGLIQGFILFSVIFRLDFPGMLFGMTVALVSFFIVAFSKPDTGAAFLQSTNVFFVYLICIAGTYFMRRYQRIDFLKTQIINDQNMQLRGLLKDIQDDHDRKIAAMNMLVHFVRTPLHQISGFSDVVLQTLARRTGDEALSAGLDGARYIKNASMDLTENVNRLLTYHRLDEYELSDEGEPVNIVDALSDYLETFEPRISFEKPEAAHTINVNRDVLDVAFQSFAVYYSEAERPVTSIKISFHVQGDAVGIIFKDDGPPIDNDDFENLTKPLTKIDKYLDVSVAKMPMLLRTVARAAELLGGGLVCGDVDDNCVFMLHMRDGASTQATDIKRNFTLAAELLPQDIAWNTATGA